MTRFTLYSGDVRDLVHHITTPLNESGQPCKLSEADRGRRRFEVAHFDVDDDGNVNIYVDAKGTLVL